MIVDQPTFHGSAVVKVGLLLPGPALRITRGYRFGRGDSKMLVRRRKLTHEVESKKLIHEAGAPHGFENIGAM